MRELQPTRELESCVFGSSVLRVLGNLKDFGAEGLVIRKNSQGLHPTTPQPGHCE